MMRTGEAHSLSPLRARAHLFSMAFLFFFVFLALLLYKRAWGFGFNSDAFVLLSNAIRNPLAWDHTYHFMPLSASWLWLQHQFFGLHQEAYEVLNIIQHGVIAILVFLLAVRLGLPRLQAFLAGLLFVCAGSAYQVVLWSVVGSNYFVSVFFYLLALLLFLGLSGKPAAKWLSTLFFTLALLAHEQSLSLYPVCFLASLFLKGQSHTSPERGWRHDFYRAITKTWPMAIPLAIFLLTKYWMSLGVVVLPTRRSFGVLIQGLSSSIVQLWSFRGDMNVGLSVSRFLDIRHHPLAIVIAGVLLVVFLLPRFSITSRFLFLWTLLQLLMMELAIGISIRHLYLPTVAASIAVLDIFSRILRHFTQRNGIVRLLLLTLVGAALVPSLIDLGKAQTAWHRADRMTKGLYTSVHRLSRTRQKISRLLILNATEIIPDSLFEIFSFKNGLKNLVFLASNGRISATLLAHTPGHNNNANGSFVITMPEVARLLRDRETAAVRLDEKSGESVRLSLKELRKKGLFRVHNPWVEMATPATRPELNWVRRKTRPSLVIFPGREIETRLTPPIRNNGWFLISWKQRPESQLQIRVGTTWTTEVQGLSPVGWNYALKSLPNLSHEPIRIPVFIRNTGGNSLRVSIFGFFRPLRMINAETAPVFYWDHANVLEIPASSQLSLPLPDRESISEVRIVCSGAKERGISLSSDGGRPIDFNYQSGEQHTWTTLCADLPQTRTLTIHASGPQSARILQVWFLRPEDLLNMKENRHKIK